MDGGSGFSEAVRRRDGIRWWVRNKFTEVHVPGDEFLRGRDRVQAVIYAYEHGLTAPGTEP